jgi:uncharacterized protein YutE (UPF0331/DUF86 family)
LVVDKEIIEKRLLRLEQSVRKLKEISRHTWEEYRDDDSLKDRAERNFQVAAQTCIDIANHVLADKALRAPVGYGDSFTVLRENGIISAELSEKMKMIAGFRNVLVHDYLEIDHKIVYDSLQRIGDFIEFAEKISILIV